MDNYYKIFNDYVKKYDFKEPMIRLKFHHTYRVVEFCREIAESLELNEEDTEIALLTGLFHDIGRFNQWQQFNTFIDEKSFDHGDEAYKILSENDFIEDKYKEIVLISVKNHNKYMIEPNLDERTKLFCNIVRDADKLDIMREQGNEIKQSEIVLKKELLDSIYNEKICGNNYITNEVDSIIRMISWVYDLNFKYSYQFLLDSGIINKKFELLEIYGETEELTKLKETIINKIKEMC